MAGPGLLGPLPLGHLMPRFSLPPTEEKHTEARSLQEAEFSPDLEMLQSMSYTWIYGSVEQGHFLLIHTSNIYQVSGTSWVQCKLMGTEQCIKRHTQPLLAY
jgi:hypothetical protein